MFSFLKKDEKKDAGKKGSPADKKTGVKKRQTRRVTEKIDRRPWWERVGIPAKAVKDRAFRKLFPYDPRHVEIGGHNMSFIDEGEGEPVVMVHGNPTWSFFYRRLIKELRGKHRCLAIDHIGCGFSDKPKKFDYTLERHIDNLEQWLNVVLPPADWNNGKFDLIVHDWGGPIGLGYAVRHPERVNRIVVMNSSVFTTGKMPRRITLCRVPILGAILVRGFNLFASLATTMATVKRMPAQTRKAYVMPYNSWRNRVAIHNFVLDIPLRKGTPSHRILSEIEDKISFALEHKPVLVQWGMKDFCFTPKFLDLWRQEFPLAEVDEYADAGHYLLEDAGDEVAGRISDFLSKPMHRPEGKSIDDPIYDSLDEPEGEEEVDGEEEPEEIPAVETHVAAAASAVPDADAPEETAFAEAVAEDALPEPAEAVVEALPPPEPESEPDTDAAEPALAMAEPSATVTELSSVRTESRPAESFSGGLQLAVIEAAGVAAAAAPAEMGPEAIAFAEPFAAEAVAVEEEARADEAVEEATVFKTSVKEVIALDADAYEQET